ncbi:hypothetical protein IP91_03392 [Pseudoduganella lurida]|uniref:Uncharacterized protein n=2 Tax=Pseudoduganella lurida TaxID=1036180 RepID=A0A562R2U3_9BURK|nr:hypothetical protein IP91_03392 [Pseudoduganella lurida]
MPPSVLYTSLAANAFEVMEDEDAGKIHITLQHGRDKVGIWEVKNSQEFGLIFNGKEMPLALIERLDHGEPPAVFNPYEAIWGKAHEGRESYICTTFNFGGLGKSGTFQNRRGLYLIERRPHPGAIFYTTGKVVLEEN